MKNKKRGVATWQDDEKQLLPDENLGQRSESQARAERSANKSSSVPRCGTSFFLQCLI